MNRGAVIAQTGGPFACRSIFVSGHTMQIAERTIEAVTILDLKGALTFGDGDTLLRNRVNRLVKRGRKHVVLNMADVPYIDSVGIGEIVGIYTTLMRRRGSLRLLNVPKRVRDLLVVTKLLTMFETFDAEAEAVRTFFTAV
jgi:anti-sigma B factor antagonist